MSIKPILPKPKQKKFVFNNEFNFNRNDEPIIPMSKVCNDVIKKLQTQPYPQLALATHSTISQALDLYYTEYIRLFKQNQLLNDQLASILIQRNSLADQFNQIKKMKSYDDNIRRRRRYASEIQRNYHCPMPKCNKGYGSQGSLTHHVRLKHPKFFQSGQYQIYLETYILPKQEIKNQDEQEDDSQIVKVSQNAQNQQAKKSNESINLFNLSSENFKNKINKANNQLGKINDEQTKKQETKNSLTSKKLSILSQEEKSFKIYQQVDGYINMNMSQSENIKLTNQSIFINNDINLTINKQQEQKNQEKILN